MKKPKKYYLVKEWNENRGTTEEKPSCFFCGSYIVHSLSEAKLDWCYTSPKRAYNAAFKHYRYSFRHGYMYSIVEVPTGNTVSTVSLF